MRVLDDRSHEGPASRPAVDGRLFLALSLAWIVLVAAVYYRQLWMLIAAGPDAWTVPDVGQRLLTTGLPFASDAAGRAARAIAAAGAIVAAAVGTGRMADRWLTPPLLTAPERFVVRLANGAGAWAFVFLLLAGLGLYRPGIVGAAVLVAALVALAWGVHGWRTSASDGAGRSLLPAAGVLAAVRGQRTWQLITVLGVAAAFVSALAPEIEYDALWYHLELPRRWLAAGRPVDDVTEYISLYPLTWQLLYGAGLALDGAPAAKLLHWTTLVASAVVAASIGRRALGVRSWWLAAALFLTAPTVLWEATTAYVDLATALHTGLAAGALFMAARVDDRRWLLLAGVQSGLACATKHLALVPVTIALFLFVVHQARTRGRTAALKRLLLLMAMTLILPSPWYVRAWSASGNPVFPELYAVFGAPPERWDHLTEEGLGRFKDHFGGGRDAFTLLALPWTMTMHGARYGGTLGPLLLMLAPMLVIVWRKSRASRWMLAGLVMYGAVWASPISSFQLRFLVPWWVMAAPLFALAAEALIDRAAEAGRGVHGLARALLTSVLILNLPPFIPWHEGDRAGWDGWLTHVVRRIPIEVVAGGIAPDAYLRREVRTYAAWSYLDERAPDEARVLTFFGGDHLYSRRARLWSEAVIARPVTWGATGDVPLDAMRARLERLSITHVMAPPPHRQTVEQAALALLRPAAVEAMLEVVYEDYWTVVYRVREAGSERGAIDQR